MTDLGIFISEAKRKLEEQAALFKRMDVRLRFFWEEMYHLRSCQWVKPQIFRLLVISMRRFL